MAEITPEEVAAAVMAGEGEGNWREWETCLGKTIQAEGRRLVINFEEDAVQARINERKN